MSWTRREILNGELMEVCELIGEWKEDLGADFLEHYAQVIATFREGYPEYADYAEERLRSYLASIGMELPEP